MSVMMDSFDEVEELLSARGFGVPLRGASVKAINVGCPLIDSRCAPCVVIWVA